MADKKRFKKIVIAAAAFSTAINLNACAYGPPTDFDPGANMNECVYGPPSIVERETKEETLDIPEAKNTETDELQTDFDPSANMNECVYGPPPSF